METVAKFHVNCRIGSLETNLEIKVSNVTVNCRIGSLEIGQRSSGK